MPQGLEGVTQWLASKEENVKLIQILVEEEIEAAIWELHPLKALDLDGFSSIFFQNFWPIV